MEMRAVRLYGTEDIRFDRMDLPPPGEGELLVKIISNTLCRSTHKAFVLGHRYARVPDSVAEKPVILGHEFCGEILEVGERHRFRFHPGQKFTIQPSLRDSPLAAGFSYPHFGGLAQYGIVPERYITGNQILIYGGDSYFGGSMAVSYSTVIGAVHASYHTQKGVYRHTMGIREGGTMAILAGGGAVGMALIDYLIDGMIRPGRLVVVEQSRERLARAERFLLREEAEKYGVELQYMALDEWDYPAEGLRKANGGFDDVFVLSPEPALVELGDAILAPDGCLSLITGPPDPGCTAPVNLYNLHYHGTHMVGTCGGNTDDMREALGLTAQGLLTPSNLVTHIGGLDAAAGGIRGLPALPGYKKLIYTHISLPLTAIDDFEERGRDDPLFEALYVICRRHRGLWNAEAEAYLLANAPAVE